MRPRRATGCGVVADGLRPSFGPPPDIAPDLLRSEYDSGMSSLEQVSQPSVAVSRDRSRAIFGQTMGLVALTCLVAALGAYLGRDISRGFGIVAFIGAIGCIIGLNVAIRRSEQLAVGLLFGMGAFLGIAVAPTLAYYAEVQPQAL